MTNTKKVLIAMALLFVGYTIGEDAPTTLGANYTTPAPSVSNELERLTQTPVATGCWVEHKQDGTAEVLSGDLALMPVGSELVSCGGSFRIEEDEPGWDCRTMGNQVCGGAPEAIGDAPRGTEIHGDTQAAHGDTRQRQGDARDRAVPEDGTSVPEGYYNEPPAPAPAKPSTPAPTAPAAPAPSSNLVNLNTASQGELEALPGVGEKTAQKIIAARPLASVGAVDAMPGVRFAEFKDLVTV